MSGETCARFGATIKWLDNDEDCVLLEKRSFTLTYPAAGLNYYYIDVESEFVAENGDAVISTVDINQFEWGGYGGIGFRASRDLAGIPERLILSRDGVISNDVHGREGDWAAYCGLRDGCFGEKWAGFAVIDHRRNPIHPVPFHASTNAICYIGTAPARFREFTIKQNAVATFRNRFVFFDGETDTSLIQDLYNTFSVAK